MIQCKKRDKKRLHSINNVLQLPNLLSNISNVNWIPFRNAELLFGINSCTAILCTDDNFYQLCWDYEYFIFGFIGRHLNITKLYQQYQQILSIQSYLGRTTCDVLSMTKDNITSGLSILTNGLFPPKVSYWKNACLEANINGKNIFILIPLLLIVNRY